MKPSTLLGLVAGGAAVVYFATKKTSASDDNPWRGSASPCEKAFDKLSPKDRKDLLEFMRTSAAAGEAMNSEVRKTIAVFLGVDATSTCTIAPAPKQTPSNTTKI